MLQRYFTLYKLFHRLVEVRSRTLCKTNCALVFRNKTLLLYREPRMNATFTRCVLLRSFPEGVCSGSSAMFIGLFLFRLWGARNACSFKGGIVNIEKSVVIYICSSRFAWVTFLTQNRNCFVRMDGLNLLDSLIVLRLILKWWGI